MQFSASRVYEADKTAAAICTTMAQNGFMYDPARSDEMAKYLRDLEATARARAEAAIGRPLAATKSGGIRDADLARAFFTELRAPVVKRSEITDKPSLGVDALRVYAASASEALRDLALAELDRRRARKLRSTYIEDRPRRDRPPKLNPHTGRVHPSWNNTGAVTGRWACSGPNLMNLPRKGNDPTHPFNGGPFAGGVRSLYRARPGCILVSFDAKQLEMRMAAYASGDPVMIAATNASDLHTANARIIFAERFEAAEEAKRAVLRDIAKSSGFAVCYMAEAETVFDRIVATGVDVRFREVVLMLRKLQRSFRGYYAWQERKLLETVKSGYVYTPILMRRRWVGHDPQAPEVANFPIQGGAADMMNIRLPAIEAAAQRFKLDSLIVAQVHDAGVFDVRVRDAHALREIMLEEFAKPVTIASSGEPLEAVFPIDIKESERWS